MGESVAPRRHPFSPCLRGECLARNARDEGGLSLLASLSSFPEASRSFFSPHLRRGPPPENFRSEILVFRLHSSSAAVRRLQPHRGRRDFGFLPPLRPTRRARSCFLPLFTGGVSRAERARR